MTKPLSTAKKSWRVRAGNAVSALFKRAQQSLDMRINPQQALVALDAAVQRQPGMDVWDAHALKNVLENTTDSETTQALVQALATMLTETWHTYLGTLLDATTGPMPSPALRAAAERSRPLAGLGGPRRAPLKDAAGAWNWASVGSQVILDVDVLTQIEAPTRADNSGVVTAVDAEGTVWVRPAFARLPGGGRAQLEIPVNTDQMQLRSPANLIPDLAQVETWFAAHPRIKRAQRLRVRSSRRNL